MKMEKQGILDVRLTMNNNTEIDIEIQLAYMKAWADRSTFYVSKMLVEQVGINKKYSNIKKCIGINILDFDYIKDTQLSLFFSQTDHLLPSLIPETRFTSCYGALMLMLSLLVSSDQLRQKADFIDPELRQMLRLIDRELPRIHNVDDIAGQMHMSRSAVYRLFASRMHTPVMTYVRTRKCMNARTMLAQGIPASEVAGSLGFTHYSSFYRDYVNLFGEAPSAPTVK